MPIRTDLTGLNNFKKRLNSINTLTLTEKVLVALCNEAVTFAQRLYADNSIIVSSIINGNVGNVFANGEQVAFLEFGAGEYAKGTYGGNLPQSGVPITGNWEYYYESNSKDEFEGTKGWWFNGTFVTGTTAQAQMWETAKYIKENAITIIRKALGVK